MTTWATAQDVRDRWIGPPELAASDTQIEVLIEDAEDTIIGEFADLQDRIDAETIPESRVIKVVCRVVIRHLRNPSGVRSVNQSAGVFVNGQTFAGEAPGAVSLTDEDRRELGGVKTGQVAFTIDTMPA
jgi:hypothetical protein